MKKRNLFTEMKEGFDALANARNVKQTLCSHEVDLNLLVAKFPDTVDRLARV
jgi:hypothetical protein